MTSRPPDRNSPARSSATRSRKPRVAVEMALHLQDQGHASGHKIAQLAERHHPVRRRLECHGLQLGRRERGQRAMRFGQAVERVVMEHHGFAVGRESGDRIRWRIDPRSRLQTPTPCSRRCRLRRRASRDAPPAARSASRGRACAFAVRTPRTCLRPRRPHRAAAPRRRSSCARGGPCRRMPSPSCRRRRS